MIVFLGLYSSVALYCFAVYLKAFQQETDLSTEELRLSWLIIVLAPLLWFIVVPISYLEKYHKSSTSYD